MPAKEEQKRPVAGMGAVSWQRTNREGRAGLGAQAARTGEQFNTGAKRGRTRRGGSKNGVEGCETGGSGRGSEEEVGEGDGQREQAGWEGLSAGQVGEEGRSGWGEGNGPSLLRLASYL